MMNELDVYRDNAENMLRSAQQDGLNPNAVAIMLDNLDKTMIAGGRGDFESASDTVVMVTLIIDESESMGEVRNIVRQCYHNLVSTLSEIVSANDIQLSTWVFNDKRKLLNSFLPIFEAPKSIEQYYPSGCTKLYDTVLSALTGQVVCSQELWLNFKQTKNIIIVISDGDDNSSKKDPLGYNTKELAQTLSEQADYILAYVGLSGSSTLSKEECLNLAGKIGFSEVISVHKIQYDMVKLFNKITFAIKRASQSTDVILLDDFFK